MEHALARGRAVVMQPGSGPSYCQRVPANGHADPTHLLAAGSACFLGYAVQHEIINEGDTELVMLWVISPPGLEDFFRASGRPRAAGEADPAPFERPSTVVAIERRLSMNDTVA